MVKKKSNSTSVFPTLLLIFSLLLVVSGLEASVRTTGSIKGKITDKQGKPLTGAYVYVSSPSLIGIQYFLTKSSGYYSFVQLPAGTYKLGVEAPGFITAIIDGLKVETGKTISLPIALEPSETEEEKILLVSQPVLDKESPKLSYLIDQNLLAHIPRPRDVASIIQLAPGVVPENIPYDINYSINGSSVRSNILSVSGNEVDDPINRTMLKNINVDWIEEVEVETGGHSVENYSAEGGFINVITRTGSNKSSGQLNFFATGGQLSHSLWGQDELSQMANPPVIEDKYHLDFSLNLEGAILPDRVWYFTNFRLNRRAQDTPFLPWRDPSNIPYPMYSWKAKDFYSLFRLTSQITPEIKASVLLSFDNTRQNVDPSFLSPTTPQIATLNIGGQSLFLANAFGSYALGRDTTASMFFFYTRNELPRRLDSKAVDQPRYVDLGTGYSWGSGPYNDDRTENIFRAGISINRFQPLFKTTHELVAGAEYESTNGQYSVWKTDNLFYYYLFGSPYYYGEAVSPESGNLVGKGLIGFYLASHDQDNLLQKSTLHRLIFFAGDNFVLSRRISFYLGLKFERTQAGLSTIYKGLSGNELSVTLGEELIKPVYELNPYGTVAFSGWDNMIVWNTLSPRLGMVIDILGNGKTLLKGSFSRYPENLSLSYLMNFSPCWPASSHLFYWYDENVDGLADTGDTYELYPEDYRIHQNTYFRKRVAPGLKSPYTSEWTASLEQQLTEDFTLSLAYISKTKTNLIEDILYDPDNDKEWSTADTPENWWIPFTTVVPGDTPYGNTTVTVYFPSEEAPSFFTRLNNVKNLKQQYSGWQIVLRKRMSNNWQFYASATWSQAQGNVDLGSLASSSFSQLANSPNSLINVTTSSRLDLDRPFSLKIMGTYRLPKDIYLSAYFYSLSGTPWARTVTIVPPESWLEEHQAQNFPVIVYLEEPGSRRLPSFQSLDLRLEKSFKVGQNTSLNVWVDVLNLLGKKYGVQEFNDGGYWYPQAEGSSSGTRIFSPNYQKILALYGTRTAQLNISLRF